MRIAQLYTIFRVGVIYQNLSNVYKENVDNLRQLISLVKPRLFKASRLCLLNPTFDGASRLVGETDVDLVIDDAIIDIKTTKNLRLERNHFNQLIGYFVLYKIAGVGCLIPKSAIKRVGIYFSRFGYLLMIHLGGVIHPETFSGFVKWFIERAEQQYAA